ncbi:MAG: hypothetical protein WA324_18385 [Bryobacteraceae bacterium]
MIDGFYRIAFTGTAGSGFGLLAFQSGVIAGADTAGGIFDGSYTAQPDTGAIDFRINMNLPAGITPVQTGIPLAAPLTMPISGSIQVSDIDGDTPTLLQTPLGPVNALFKKVRDLP